MKILLHVGCGTANISNLPQIFHDGNWDEIRYDAAEDVAPDLIGTMQDMSLIEDGTIDAIYSSHNLEHVWAHEVPIVLTEFYRVLKDNGFILISCPDVISVAEAVAFGKVDQPVYMSPAGPITPLDILYGWSEDLRRGRHYMAHKTAFSSQTLANAVLEAGFAGICVGRDKVFGLNSIVTKQAMAPAEAEKLIDASLPHRDQLIETNLYGRFML